MSTPNPPSAELIQKLCSSWFLPPLLGLWLTPSSPAKHAWVLLTRTDLVRFDPDAPFTLAPAKLHSRCRNTPFDEARMEGKVKLTLVAGNVAHE